MFAQMLIALLLLVPVAVGAQEDELRAQIRADLMQDPRTAQLSAPELDALVAALANEANSSGEADVYLDAKNAPTFTYDPAPIDDTSPWLLILTAPIVIALAAFIAALLGVVLFLMRRRKDASAPPAVA